MAPQARPARKDDVRELSRTLARAFYDDPVMIWLLPDEKPRTVQLYRLFATMTRRHYLAHGGVQMACDGPGIGRRRCGIRRTSGRKRVGRSWR
jgi:hypothetical protein